MVVLIHHVPPNLNNTHNFAKHAIHLFVRAPDKVVWKEQVYFIYLFILTHTNLLVSLS